MRCHELSFLLLSPAFAPPHSLAPGQPHGQLHDPFGRRIAKTITQGKAAQTTYYIYGEHGLMAEANEQGTLTKAYGFHPDAQANGLWSTNPVWQADVKNGKLKDEQTQWHYLHTDHLGTPYMATNRQGEKTWRAHANSFGEAIIDKNSTTTVNLRFPGQYYDEETQTHYNFQRDYSPYTGRYLQADPIGLRAGINFYAYVDANPLKFADWLGLYTIDPNCCQHDENLKKDLDNACLLVTANIQGHKLRSCIMERCKSAHVSCDGVLCWLMNTKKTATFGWNSLTTTANLCIEENKHLNNLLGWSCVAIHEWAHSCGWKHLDGKGVPYNSGGLEYNEIENCLSKWNTTNQGPGRHGQQKPSNAN